MTARGVHFAITDDDLFKLQQASSSAEIIDIVTEDIEERWEKQAGFVAETDKAWDAIHRCLTNGKLEYEGGDFPLKLCILGGRLICEEDDYLIALVDHAQLADLVAALRTITKTGFRDQYDLIPPEDYDGTLNDDDFEYTWSWFSKLPMFFHNAAKADRHVIFTVSM